MTKEQKALNGITSRLAKIEGKKEQVSIGNIREVVRCLIELEIQDLQACNSIHSTLSQLTGIATHRFFELRSKLRTSAIRKKQRKKK